MARRRTTRGSFWIDHNVDIETCLGCLRKVKQFVKAYKTVRSDGQKDVVGSSDESWLELKHCVSRMLAYEEATKSLSNAGKTWPQLFDKFKVCHIPSSKPGSTPLGKASHSAEAIIGRMSSDQAIMDTFHEYAEEMRMFDLDDRIREECTRTSFKPIIHSEILVQDWISRQGQNHYLRFFNGWRYIGSSKPPCRMCKYYFEACGSDITLRESHRNIYPNWGFPNAHGPEGSPAAKRWQKSLNRMMDRIRQDAFKVIIEKCSESKRHDSITYDFHSEWSSRPSQPSVRSFRAESVAADDGSESDIAELGDLLRDGLTLTTHGGDHSDDEEDGGGALL